MSNKPFSGNPFFDAWMHGQERFFKAQKEWMEAAGSARGSEAFSDTLKQAQQNWNLCEEQVDDWVKSAQQRFATTFESEETGGISEETLRRMLDPSRFLNFGLDEIGQAIHRLVQAPEFADIGVLERDVLKMTREWINLQNASAAYRTVVTAAWIRAFDTFSAEMVDRDTREFQSIKCILNRWLDIANEELIRTQRTDEFLDAQRKLLRTGADYRLKQREIVEMWCESLSIPTRTEVDDLHSTVHRLRRELRELKRLDRQKNLGADKKPRMSSQSAKSAKKSKSAKKKNAAGKKATKKSTTKDKP